jgi:hypothetical protein
MGHPGVCATSRRMSQIRGSHSNPGPQLVGENVGQSWQKCGQAFVCPALRGERTRGEMRILAVSGKCHNANLSFALQPFLTPGVLASFAGDFAFRGPAVSDPGGGQPGTATPDHADRRALDRGPGSAGHRRHGQCPALPAPVGSTEASGKCLRDSLLLYARHLRPVKGYGRSPPDPRTRPRPPFHDFGPAPPAAGLEAGCCGGDGGRCRFHRSASAGLFHVS